MSVPILTASWSDESLTTFAHEAGLVRAAVGEARMALVTVASFERTKAPTISFVREASYEDVIAPDAVAAVTMRADAYASDADSLSAAATWLTSQARDPRSRTEALALRYLGSLGERRPAGAPQLGEDVPLSGPITLGRSEACTIRLRQGAHSDQNVVARIHAELRPEGEGARVVDRGSTNGTWVNGARIRESILHVGEELVIAYVHRFVLVGPSR